MPTGEMKMPLCFAYGSNLDVDQMRRRCPESRVVIPGRLRDYSLGFTSYSPKWAGGVSDVIIHPEMEVWGVIYNLSQRDLELLDAYEGYPDVYTRFQVTIHSLEELFHDVWVYAVVKKQDNILPSKRYLDIIKNGADRFGFPQSYRCFLDGIEFQGT
jgi:gamma-glutamylcyclotransferase (GGCT)/AIG2-like uncharacterized protein YtfP